MKEESVEWVEGLLIERRLRRCGFLDIWTWNQAYTKHPAEQEAEDARQSVLWKGEVLARASAQRFIQAIVHD